MNSGVTNYENVEIKNMLNRNDASLIKASKGLLLK